MGYTRKHTGDQGDKQGIPSNVHIAEASHVDSQWEGRAANQVGTRDQAQSKVQSTDLEIGREGER